MFQLNFAAAVLADYQLAEYRLNDDSDAHGPVVEDTLDDELVDSAQVDSAQVVDEEVTGDRLAEEQSADDVILLSVSSMPLSVFASAIEEGKSISIEVDESIADFTVDGQFNGSIEYLLDDLYDRYGINHSVSGNVYELWRDTDFSSQLYYQFQLSDMDLVAFLSYLSDAAGYQLIADTSININVDGTYSGTLRDTINALSHQYPVLFYVSEDTISVVPESSFVKSVVSLTEDNYSPEAFLTDLRSKIPPGNFVNREDNQLIVGGHPDFVRRTELELQVDMSNTAAMIPDLLKNQFPAILATDNNTRVDQPLSEPPANTAGSVPLVLINQQGDLPGAAALSQKTVTAESPVQDTENAVVSEPNTEESVTPVQAAEAAVTPESGAGAVDSPERRAGVAIPPEQEADVDVTSAQETELAVKVDENIEDTAAAVQGGEVEAVPVQDAVIAEQDAEIEVVAEQGAENTVLAEKDDDVDVAPEQDAGDTAASDQDTGVAGSPEQDADELAAKLKSEIDAATTAIDAAIKAEKTKAKVGSVDDIPGFY